MGYLNSDKWTRFHLIMTLVCLGLPMVIIEWDKLSTNTQLGTMTYWESVVSLGLGYVVYVWSIFCTKCYPDRDLSELESYFKEFELS